MLDFAEKQEIVLRPYQDKSVQGLRDGIAGGAKRQILVAPTGAGKTVIAAHLLKQANDKGSYALFLVDRVSLVDQTSATLDSYGVNHGIIQGINQRYDPYENIQVCSIQTLARRKLPRNPNLIIYDECFPGDVEVLTAGGFTRFDQIVGNEEFAQYDMDTEAISFTPALRTVKRPANGDVRRIRSDRRIDLMLTAGHELIVESKKRGREKVRVEDFRAGDKRIPVAGFAIGDDKFLSPRERFLIAYQADGSLHLTRKDGGATAAFSFSKQRKIDSFLRIVSDAGYEATEVQGRSSDSENTKDRRRFLVSLPFTPSKNLGQYFDISVLSSVKAEAIIREAVQWDGHVLKRRPTNLSFNTTSLETADFLQSLAALCGMRATMRKFADDRSEKFSDIYRLYIVSDTRNIGCQKLKPEPVEYDGDVYCVTVPTGCIVVRQNGKTAIVGNCHCRYKAIEEYIDANPQAVVIGLTATPFTAGMADRWGGMVNVTTTMQLVRDKFLIEPTIYVAKSPDEKDFERNSYGEFSDSSAASAGILIIGDVVSEWVGKTFEHFGGPAKTIVFSPTVEHGRELCQAFRDKGYNFQQISYLDRDDDERRKKIEEFRRPDSEIHGLVSCGVLTKGFDVGDVLIGVSCKPYRKSLSAHLQEIGRVMRTHPGKEKALWLCHSGNVERFAIDQCDVWENGAGELSSSTKRDSEPRERTEQKKEAVVCPECSGTMNNGTCRACGWERPARSGINAVEGELQAFDLKKFGGMEPRAGLRAECLSEPKIVWRAALNYCVGSTGKGEQAGRKWAYGVFRGIYPNNKLPAGWFDAPVPPVADANAVALIEREVKRFRKKTRRAA